MSNLILITGNSGVGKTTLLNNLVKSNLFNHIITTTTRKPRDNEINGKDYHFVSHEYFIKNNKDYLFKDFFFDNWYGLDKNEYFKSQISKNPSLIIVRITSISNFEKLFSKICIVNLINNIESEILSRCRNEQQRVIDRKKQELNLEFNSFSKHTIIKLPVDNLSQEEVLNNFLYQIKKVGIL